MNESASTRFRTGTRRDRGSTSLTTVLLAPVFLVIFLMAFQGAMWTHTRTEARAVARDAARSVARAHMSTELVRESALDVLAADVDLGSPSVVIETVDDAGATVVVVTIEGRAPGMIRGTSHSIRVREGLPLEGWQP